MQCRGMGIHADVQETHVEYVCSCGQCAGLGTVSCRSCGGSGLVYQLRA